MKESVWRWASAWKKATPDSASAPSRAPYCSEGATRACTMGWAAPWASSWWRDCRCASAGEARSPGWGSGVRGARWDPEARPSEAAAGPTGTRWACSCPWCWPYAQGLPGTRRGGMRETIGGTTGNEANEPASYAWVLYDRGLPRQYRCGAILLLLLRWLRLSGVSGAWRERGRVLGSCGEPAP